MSQPVVCERYIKSGLYAGGLKRTPFLVDQWLLPEHTQTHNIRVHHKFRSRNSVEPL